MENQVAMNMGYERETRIIYLFTYGLGFQQLGKPR